MTRPKDKGTAGETLVVKYLQSTYWPFAERRALSGGLDKGDITGTPGLAWEVKAVKTLCVPAWLRETEAERINAKADYAVLVIKPQGVGARNVGEFYALMDFERFRQMTGRITGSGNAPIGWIGDRFCFDTTIRKTGLASALEWSNRHQPPGTTWYWIRYPNFVLTTLEQMCRILLLAGYGSTNKREKDQA